MHQPMAQHNPREGTDDKRPSEEPSTEELSDFAAEEESTFSRWTLPVVLFALTVCTTLWAGAYQAYSGTIRGPVAFLWEHPEMLW